MRSLGNTIPAAKEGQSCCPATGKPQEPGYRLKTKDRHFFHSFKFPTKKS